MTRSFQSHLHDVHHDPSDDDRTETATDKTLPGLVGREGSEWLVDESTREASSRIQLATPLETTDVCHRVVPGDRETGKNEPHQSIHDDGDNRADLENNNDDRQHGPRDLSDLVLQVSLLQTQHNKDKVEGVEGDRDQPMVESTRLGRRMVSDNEFGLGDVLHETHCCILSKNDEQRSDKDEPMKRAEVRNLLFHRLLVTDAKQLVEQTKLHDAHAECQPG